MMGKGKLRLTPAWLPVIRSHLAAEQRAQSMRASSLGTVSERMLAEFYDETDMMLKAPLWWVSRDMKTLCVDTVVNGPMPPATRLPTSTGLIVFEGGFVVEGEHGHDVPVDAVFWQEVADHVDGNGLPGLIIRLYGSDPKHAIAKPMDRTLPILPLASQADKIDTGSIAMMQTALALMNQPSVTSVGEHRWDPRSDGPQPGSLRLAPKVKMIVLREHPHPGIATTGEAGSGRFTHRFIVRGFYRNQAYGRDHALRRRQWIPPFVKGPAGTPLIVKDSVRIWRRL